MRSVCLLGLLLGAGAASAAEMIDEFDSEPLDACVWNTKQADYPRLIKFETAKEGDSTVRYLANLVDERREDSESRPATCKGQILALSAAVDEFEDGEDLGPSLILPELLQPFAMTPECSVPERRNGKVVHQRNELRLRSDADRHPLTQPHWYRILMKADGDIPSCGSARWVTAQWKYDDPDWPSDKEDPSPFLAQRFDNGVLYVTVQNGECRCMVAKAEGDPDRTVASLTTALPASGPLDLKEISPLSCAWSGDTEGDCLADATIKVLSPTAPEPPPLPDPQQGWADMIYHVKGGLNGQVDVYANGQLVVRVTGLIGYQWGTPGLVKFKFGTYRDKVPGKARLLYDRICIAESASACDPDLHMIDETPQ